MVRRCFDEYLYKYGLHDCIIDSIYIVGDRLHLNMSSGVYNLTPNGTESEKTSPCDLVLEIDDFDKYKPWQHIEINKSYKRKVYDVNFDSFIKKVKKYKFDIDNNYFSAFCNTILIHGYLDKGKYEIIISEIKSIQFVFD